MKRLIILFFLSGVFIKDFAQQPKIGIDPENKFKNHKLFNLNDSLNKFPTNFHYLLITSRGFSQILANGDKVYLLQDGMPCIVPEMSRYNYHMPVYKGKIEGTIPNASPPLQLLPKEKS